MKQTELRIGNIVTVDNPKYHPQLKGVLLRVTGIQEQVISNKIEYCVQLEHINKKANTYYQTYSQFVEYIKPVALTEHWLLDFGFKNENGYYSKGAFLISLADDASCFFKDGRVYFNSRVIIENQSKYVHQLQNLYFTLTGEDLILKEK